MLSSELLLSTRNSGERALKYLMAMRPPASVADLHHLGVILANALMAGQIPALCDYDVTTHRQDGTLEIAQMSEPFTLVELPREGLLAWANTVAISSPPAAPVRPDTAHLISSLAVSFAISGDLAVVAALIRAASRLGVQEYELSECLEYLIDTQQSDGSFGLVAPELAILGHDGQTETIQLRLTVETLWALAMAVQAWRSQSLPAANAP